jgi:predicted permease
MNILVQDLRYAVRTLKKSPGFTALAVLTLALGIGAATALFSVVEGVLLRSLPYPEPERLVQLWQLNDKGGRTNFSDPNYVDVAERSQSFQGLAQFAGGVMAVTGGSEPARVGVMEVSREFFHLLGVAPVLGRTFAPEEQQAGGVPAVLVSHGFWQRYLGGAPDVAGRALRFESAVYTVVGVLPPSFDFPAGTDLWIPSELSGRATSRTGHNWRVLGRLRDGVSLEQARQEVSAIARRLKGEYGSDTWMEDATVVSLRDQLVGRARPALLVLLGAAAFLLLIASANVTNLLLARVAARQRELAIRLALGANRWRVALQFLSESLVLALSGGALGVLLATWGVRLLLAFEPGTLPRVAEIGVNPTVLAFALGTSVLVALALALFAALRALRDELRGTLAQSQRTTSAGRSSQRLRGSLAAAQVALTVVLLVGAGLLARSFLSLLAVDPGFRTTSTIAMNIMAPAGRDPAEQARLARFHEELAARLRAIPGVKEVGGVNAMPLQYEGANGQFLILNRPDEVSTFDDWDRINRDETRTGYSDYRVADAGYFRALGIPLVRGRLFDERDTPEAPHVAVISESLAKKRWPNEDPIGKLIQFGNMDYDLRAMTIVGVVGDVRDQGLDAQPYPTFYGNARQRTGATGRYTYVLHGDFNAAAVTAAARTALRELNPEIPPRFRTIEEIVSSNLSERRFNLLLLGVFGGTALLLAVMGIYGVIAYLVTQQTREIGIRVALGAARRDVLGMVVGRGVRFTAYGLAAGLLAAFWLTRLLSGLLFNVSATDPLTFGAIALLLLTVTAVASYVPARRAARVDPMVALRTE